MEKLCAQTDADVFFPENSAQHRLAKSICNRCLSLTTCKEDAIANNFSEYGIQGGLSPKERRIARKAL